MTGPFSSPPPERRLFAGDRFRQRNAVTNGWLDNDLDALGYLL